MERSSKFISLSGLSGVFAGIFAIVGAFVAFFYLDYDLRYFNPDVYFNGSTKYLYVKDIIFLLAVAASVLVLAVAFAFFFTIRKAKKLKLSPWNHSSKLLMVNLAIPLATGGIFTLLLLYYGLVFLVAPSTLTFYGLSLINASKHTLNEIKWLGVSEVVLGLTAMFIPGYGLFVWALGFGILHIFYGIIMYFKYEHNKL